MRKITAYHYANQDGLVETHIVEDNMTLTVGVNVSLEHATTWAEANITKMIRENWRGEGAFEDVPDYYTQIMRIAPELGKQYGWEGA